MSYRFISICILLSVLTSSSLAQESSISDPSKELADSLANLGLAARSSGDYEGSQKNYLKALEMYSALKLHYRAGVTYYNLAKTYYSNYEDSLMILADREAVRLFNQVDSIKQEAMAYNQLGNHLSGIGSNNESIVVYEKAIQLSRSIGDSLTVSFYKNNLGLTLKTLGEYQNGLAHLYESLALKEAYGGSDRAISSSLLNIGLVLDLLNKPKESLLFYARAVEYKQKAGDSLGMARVYGNMAVIHKNLEHYDSAIHLINSSNQILSRFSDDDLLYTNQTNLGNLFKRKGEFSKAKEHLQAALSLAIRENDKNHIGDTYQNLGSLAFDSGDSEQCIRYNLKALDFTQETQSYAQLMEIHGNLQEAYASIGSFEKAHRSAMYALQYRDSVYRLEQVQSAEEMQTKYETQKKEEQILFQETRLIQQASIILRNRIIISALVLIGLLSFFLVWLWRVKQKRQLALAQKDHEIAVRDAEMTAIIYSQEKERKRFATDLHDGFGQLISVLKLNLGRLNGNNVRDIELRQQVYEQSEHVINDMYSELRNICFDLMPQTLVKRGLPVALQESADRINNSGSVVVEVMTFEVDARLPEVLEVSLYRISQEWINNVLKYSGATQITIQLVGDEDELTLTIEDNGKGFDQEVFYKGVGNGWRNISSRLNLIHGEFDLDTQTNSKGSMVTINVPVRQEASVPTGTDSYIMA